MRPGAVEAELELLAAHVAALRQMAQAAVETADTLDRRIGELRALLFEERNGP